jgi:hypothetical protein
MNEVFGLGFGSGVLHFAFTYKHNYQNVLLHPFLKIKFKKTAEQLLDNWQKMLEQESK